MDENTTTTGEFAGISSSDDDEEKKDELVLAEVDTSDDEDYSSPFSSEPFPEETKDAIVEFLLPPVSNSSSSRTLFRSRANARAFPYAKSESTITTRRSLGICLDASARSLASFGLSEERMKRSKTTI